MSKVLIVEDDPMVALINKRYLEAMESIEILGPVASEEEILSYLEEQEIDLILLDVYLPQKNGIDILKTLREKHYFMDVIMITAANSSDEVKQAYAYGAIDYLVKPFELSRFQKAVEKHLHKKLHLPPKMNINQKDIDNTYGGKQAKLQLPKGLNKMTLEKIIIFLKQDTGKVWTLRELAQAIDISNVTIKKYMDYLEQSEQITTTLTSGHVGRPQYRYKINL